MTRSYKEFKSICKSLCKTQVIPSIDNYSVVLDGSLETIEKSFGTFLLWREMENTLKHFRIETMYTIGRMATLLAISYKLDIMETFYTYIWHIKRFNYDKKSGKNKEWESSKMELEKVLRERLEGKKKLFGSDIISSSTYYAYKQNIFSIDDVIQYCIPCSSTENMKTFYQISPCDWKRTSKLKKSNPEHTLLLGNIYESFELKEWLEKNGFISYIHSPPKRDLNIWIGIQDAVYSNLSLSHEYIPKWKRVQSSIKVESELSYKSKIYIRFQLYILCVFRFLYTLMSVPKHSDSLHQSISYKTIHSHVQHIYEWWINVLSTHLPCSTSSESSLNGLV